MKEYPARCPARTSDAVRKTKPQKAMLYITYTPFSEGILVVNAIFVLDTP